MASVTESTTDRPMDPDDIRQRMCEVRKLMSAEAAGVRTRARELSDWKYYVRHYRTPTLIACAVVGYLIVPRRIQVITPDPKALEKLAKRQRLVVEPNPVAHERKGIIDTLLSLGAGVLLRAGVAYAGQRINQVLAQKPTGAETSPVPHPEEMPQ